VRAAGGPNRFAPRQTVAAAPDSARAEGPAEQPRVDLSITNLDITREDLSIRTVSIERVGHPRRFVVSTNPHDAPPIAIRN